MKNPEGKGKGRRVVAPPFPGTGGKPAGDYSTAPM